MKGTPREVFNWKLVFATLSAAMAGSLFGFDTGNIGGIIVLDSFKKTFGLDANGPNAYQAAGLSANIVTTLQAGAVLGALFAYILADRYGRRAILAWGAAVFLFGCALQLVANLEMSGCLYAGRLLAGIATGLTSVVSPMYISENAPKAVRGALATCFNLIILISLSIAFWINYAMSKWSHTSDRQWRIPMGIQMIPGGLLLTGMLFQRETPRYLIIRGCQHEAIHILARLRGLPVDHPFVQSEISEISQSVEEEQKAVAGTSRRSLLKEMFVIPRNRRRLIFAAILQVYQQMTGTNAINYYAPSIFASVGVSSTTATLFTTGLYGIVKVVTTLLYVLFIVDNVGRRRPLITGALIQAVCLLYLAVFVKIAHPGNDGISAGGYVGIVAIYIYAFGWSFGWSVVPWVVPSEIFPNRIRALAISIVYALQWLLNFAITRATPYMMLNMGAWAAYLLFSLFTFLSAAWAFACFPELKGRSIESMDVLFQESLMTMRKRAYENSAVSVASEPEGGHEIEGRHSEKALASVEEEGFVSK
ncbi:quinate permease [Fistulina hepatica ATCC 64428]|uniref:Quinate permease n=1 Tax=Fistulina hepatica ATCC 64428 TaxID=1128425 RepID=A0A0D7A4D2_9AGAR|nr:quinate permease [Fistulina hepatica ATCC 64428]